MEQTSSSKSVQVSFQQAPEEALEYITDLAHRIWPHTFGEILSPQQLTYMLDWMYAPAHLAAQAAEGHRFYLVYTSGEEVPIGFFGIQHALSPPEELRDLPAGATATKIHKAYLLPERQGTGIGRSLFTFIQELALQAGSAAVFLNVNKYNVSAIRFYERIGFTRIREEVIDIGAGYVMDDYVYAQSLRSRPLAKT
ncbi:N-acetyltransferase GCN5 [Nitritalea halalkaliphila LW7]|uniref:N-acetyltransferase GCN5 n=1 Tax=Nitritalea halalkaliphila LW7 TaxID=1189621 RepID=I5C2G2_9BACT|nr:GNAT family N-acetyltransferase [Nitritalea halalkaliphila]EIM76014.1 N-acetyltransferase GCN5 [Nitritalea halalkaliphila LW7]